MTEEKKEENSEEKQETKHSDIPKAPIDEEAEAEKAAADTNDGCLLYTSPSPRD